MFDILDKIGIVTGIGGAVFSLLIWIKLRQKEKFNEQRIRIQFKKLSDGSVEALPYEMERKHLTRAEVQGLLGTVPRVDINAPVYKLSFVSKVEFFNRLKATQDDELVNTLEIDCTDEEFAQFDFEKMRQ